MYTEPDADRAMLNTTRSRPRRGAWMQLLSALLELGQGKAELLRHTDQPWASVTFSGSRHSISLAFSGSEAVAAGEALIDALPEHEFTIPRQLVADAAVVAVEHTLLPQPRLQVDLDILLLEDG